MKQWIIYQHVRKDNGKSYVGLTQKSLEKRWCEHVKESQRGSTKPFHKAIRLVSDDSWEHLILAEGIETFDEAAKLEIKFIEELKTKISENGYNCTDGGDGFRGGTHSEEARKKLSEAGKGRKHTEEAKEKIRNALLGKPRSEELKEKVSKANKGRKRTDEQRMKISEGQLGRKDSEETRARKIEWLNRESSKENLKASLNTREYKEKRAKIASSTWEDPDIKRKRKEAISIALKAYWEKRKAEKLVLEEEKKGEQ